MQLVEIIFYRLLDYLSLEPVLLYRHHRCTKNIYVYNVYTDKGDFNWIIINIK